MIVQLLTILSCAAIAIQDITERMVYWILFPITGVFLAWLHLQQSNWNGFLINTSGNWLIVATIIMILWVYTKFFRKQKFLNASLGLGDILCLFAFALGFPTVTFIVLLASSLCFSVLAYIVLNYVVDAKTVPLAGFICLFLIGVLIISKATDFVSLYAI